MPDNEIHPRRIRLEASTHCQLRCPSCPTTAGAIDAALGKGHLRFADFRKLVDDNPGLQAIELSNYGEILLNPELVPILEYAHERHIVIRGGAVNLNHASDAVLDAIVRTGVDRLSVSIDGASPGTYARYRVRGDFDRVLANIRRINELKQLHRTTRPALTWQFIVFGHNEHEIAEARRMAGELEMEFSIKLSWDDEISPIRDRRRVAAEIGSPAVTRTEYRELHGQPYLSEICEQLWVNPQINWNGDVLGCCRNFWGTFGANAFTDGLQTAVNNERMQYARRMLSGQAPPREDIPCTSCELYVDRAAAKRWRA